MNDDGISSDLPESVRGAGRLTSWCFRAACCFRLIGLGVLTVSRSNSRTSTATADLDEATALAESGVEWGLVAVAADTSWRSTYTHNVETTPKTMGRGRISFKLVAATGTSLASGDVRLYGVGRVGVATRVYSVLLTGAGATLDVLKSAAHAAGDLTVNESLTATGGAISSNGQLQVKASKTVTGDVKGMALRIDGAVTGAFSTLTTALAMPVASVFDTYKAKATTLTFSSIASGTGTIDKKVLSPGNNTVIAAAGVNADGVYYIKVPSTGTLTIKASRLVATLVVELDPGAAFSVQGANAWTSAKSDYPALIIKAGAGSSVALAGSSSNLSELSALVNYNPTGTPYPYPSGSANTTTMDSYPSQIQGLIHVIGASVTTSLLSNFNLKGAILGRRTHDHQHRRETDRRRAAGQQPPVGLHGRLSDGAGVRFVAMGTIAVICLAQKCLIEQETGCRYSDRASTETTH